MFSDNSLFDPYRDVLDSGTLEAQLMEEFRTSDFSISTARAAMYGQFLPFDTEIFKMRSAILKGFSLDDKEDLPSFAHCLDLVLERLKAEGITFVSCKIHHLDIRKLHLLEDAGFRVMNCQQQFRFDYSKELPQLMDSKCRIRLGGPSDADMGGQLGRQSFRNHFDRFHNDPRLKRSACDDLHAQWVRNSLLGFADSVLIAEVDGEPAGFATLKVNMDLSKVSSRRVGDFPLLGVIPKYRGLGIHTHLLHRGLELWKGQVDWAEIVTEAINIPTQRTYATLKFKLISSFFVLHKHFEESES